ncbi:hypothetical protein Poli38472_010489 [Pythium oligandrum]|uniref:Pseudouridine synthase RsuA/RluA-like domain-containing protein n=1 Tax=Pythium oligandrum TaxID=41045 RepID=A0A8K1FDH7_PYTOL|nr:hypothetical protein Poli38472_010489 [Pythium oligandrum]|eukprot:TMW55607.1 hypothetical protein Poli38472_010489 [Pythium oligandrum]
MMEWLRVMRWMQRAVAPREHAMRADRWLRHVFPHVPQSFLQKQLRQRKIRVVNADGTKTSVKPQDVLLAGTTVAIDAFLYENGLQGTAAEHPQSEKAYNRSVLDDLVQRILYDDDNFLILNKPPGLVVQDGSRLETSLVSYLPALGAVFNDEPPRLVHRLDKDTSGLLVLARHRLAAARFTELLQGGGIQKTYNALVTPRRGRELPKSGEIDLPVQNQPARSYFKRVDDLYDRPEGTLWLEMLLDTGRKHQLRVHCAQGLNAPIVGDRKYGGVPRYPGFSERLYLHAKRLRFQDPFQPKRVIDITCEMAQSSSKVH